MHQYSGDIVHMKDTHFFEDNPDVTSEDIWAPIAIASGGAVMLGASLAFSNWMAFPLALQMSLLAP